MSVRLQNGSFELLSPTETLKNRQKMSQLTLSELWKRIKDLQQPNKC